MRVKGTSLPRRLLPALALLTLSALLANVSFAAPLTTLNATYTIATPPTSVAAGATLQASVQVNNTGDEAWNSTGTNLVNLSYHWYDAAGQTVVWEGQRTPLGGDIPVQGLRVVTATVAAPATPGIYQLRFALVKEGIGWFAPSAPMSITVQPALFSAGYTVTNAPASAPAGAVVQISVGLTNTGNQVWNTTGANPVNLTYHWYDAGGNVPMVWEGVRTPLGENIAPAAAKTMNANVTLPPNPGPYTLRFALVKEGIAWFPPAAPVVVSALPPFVAQVTATAVPPMIAGGTYTVPVTVKNNGAAAWNATGANPIDVAYHWHDFAGNTVVWDGARTALPADVAPNATAQVSAKVTAPPTGGAYTLTVDLVREGVGWFGTGFGSAPFRAAAVVETARFAASYALPATIDAYWLESKTVSVTLTNTGNQTWNVGGANPVNLSFHIFDALNNAVVWDGPRTPLGADIAPGGTKTLQVAFTAPSLSGRYTLAIDLVREGIGWFADSGSPSAKIPFAVTSGLNGGYGVTTTPGQVTIGAVVDLNVTVINYSGRVWPAFGPNPVHLSYHIVGANTGTVYTWDGARGTLPNDVPPATQAIVPMHISMPAATGDYIIKWDLVQEGVAWFSQVNVAMKQEPFTVVSGVFFYGSGFGHGVGMSQYGAQGYATGVAGAPMTGEQIIQKYFPGTSFQFGDSARPFNRVLLSQPSSQARYRCGTNNYFDGYFGDVASNGGFRVLDEEHGNLEIGRGANTAKWQFVARGGVVEVWSNNGAAPVKIGSYNVVTVVPLDTNFPLRFFQKDQLDGRPGFYRGNLRFTNLGNTLRVINAATYDDYTRGVISFEMPNSWHPEALKAQAYAARSYAYASYRGTARDYDVSDDQSDQCYAGVTAEGPTTNAAVASTAGKLVTYQGGIAKTYFASSSGGYTLEFGCWGNRVIRSGPTWVCTPDATQPFLAAVPDPGDRRVAAPANPRASWTATFTGSQVVNAVICAGGPNIGVLQGVDVSNQSPPGSGHVISVRLIGSAASADVRAETFLQTCLGLRSTMVRLAPF